jgi:hypothetical protein
MVASVVSQSATFKLLCKPLNPPCFFWECWIQEMKCPCQYHAFRSGTGKSGPSIAISCCLTDLQCLETKLNSKSSNIDLMQLVSH